MKKGFRRIHWYQILRGLLPIAFTVLLALGYMTKSFLFMAILMGITFLGGAWFCGWVCPFGYAQEWLGKLGRLFHIPRISIPSGVERWIRFTRYLLLSLSLLGFGVIFPARSPYASFMGVIDQNMSFITQSAWILMILFLVLSLTNDRLFCRYFCTEGARYGIISLARVFSITRNEEKCVSCMKCDLKCPSQIEVSRHSHVRNAQCINCMECIAACPVKGTLKYGWTLKHK